MTLFESVKGTVNTAVDTISAVAQTIVEKNRTNAKLNRLRLVMKSESELMNRAYIALGKHYYEMQKKGEAKPDENQQQLFEVIEKSKAKIAKARDCYRKIVDSQNDFIYGVPENSDYKTTDVVDITVACSNENEYESSPFDSAEKPSEENVSAEVKEEAEETEESFTDDAEDDAADDSESPNSELF